MEQAKAELLQKDLYIDVNVPGSNITSTENGSTALKLQPQNSSVDAHEQLKSSTCRLQSKTNLENSPQRSLGAIKQMS